jgi:hypothetical protein
MSVHQHVVTIPSEDELRQLVGAATPHFAFQARDRIAALAASLPPDHPRRAELDGHLARLDALGYEGEAAGISAPDLPARPPMDPRPPG